MRLNQTCGVQIRLKRPTLLGVNDCESDRKGSKIKAADLTVSDIHIHVKVQLSYLDMGAKHLSHHARNKLKLLLLGGEKQTSFHICCIKLDHQRSKGGKKS